MKTAAYLFLFLLIMIALGFIHSEVTSTPIPFLFQSYSINFILAAVALLLLSIGLKFKKENLATYYLITVALKLAVYFLFFHPKFRSDGVLTRSEFFVFFIPYALGLLAEIILLAKRTDK